MMASRYSCPDFLLDGYIGSGELSRFIHEFWNICQDSLLYEFWLNKDFKHSFNDFKEMVFQKSKHPLSKKLSDEELKAIIESSRDMLTQFEFKESTHG